MIIVKRGGERYSVHCGRVRDGRHFSVERREKKTCSG